MAKHSKSTRIVTRDGLQEMIDNAQPHKQGHIIGRALCHLLERQTRDEAATKTTRLHNGVGFTGADAYSGTLTARYYKRQGFLMQWQIDKWTKRNKNGYSRITKYWKQLDEVAQEKAGTNQNKQLELKAEEYYKASRGE